MGKIDFEELALFCIDRYKNKCLSANVRYVKTTFVAISEDNEVLCSTTPHILRNAYCCILIHVRCELAVTNWYNWYNIEYINEIGCVTDGKLDNGFRLHSNSGRSYNDQRLNLWHDIDTNNSTRIFSFPTPFEDKMQKVWNLYLRVKKAKSNAEIELITEMIEKDEAILEQEKEIASLNFTNKLLEKEKKQYKKMLDDIKELVKK